MIRSRILRTVLILVLAGLAITGIVDDVSEGYAQQALKRALTTFAVARTLNGVISVAQGTEVALEPGGVGIIMTPGQVLDPVNDLVERFSSVMLVAASSIGLQMVLLEISSWIGITILFVAGLAVWLVSTWSGWPGGSRPVSTALRLTVLLAFIRFAVPVVIIATNLVFNAFLETRHDQATAELRGTSIEIERLSERNEQSTEEALKEHGESASNAGDSVLDYLRSAARDWYSDASDWFGDVSVTARMTQLKESASNAASDIVNLIVVFVLETVIFPLAFLWLFLESLKGLAARAIPGIGGK